MPLSYYYYPVMVFLLITLAFWSAGIFNEIAINFKKLHVPKQDYKLKMEIERFHFWTYTFEMGKDSACSYDKALEWKQKFMTHFIRPVNLKA